MKTMTNEQNSTSVAGLVERRVMWGCSDCGGTGEIKLDYSEFRLYRITHEECSRCNGTGKITHNAVVTGAHDEL
jgi:DnaJ-class molecular chaperone